MTKFTAKDVGRLPKGAGMKGPDHYGCINSGLQPVILHAQTGREGANFYIVGPDCPAVGVREKVKLSEFRFRVFGERDKDGDLTRRIWREKNDPHEKRTVWVFKSRKPAVEKFIELCEKVVAWNNEQREAHKKAIADSKSSDPATRMAGAFAAADF